MYSEDPQLKTLKRPLGRYEGGIASILTEDSQFEFTSPKTAHPKREREKPTKNIINANRATRFPSPRLRIPSKC